MGPKITRARRELFTRYLSICIKLLIYERTEQPDGHLLFTSILLPFLLFPPRTPLGRCYLLTSGGGSRRGGGVTGLEIGGDFVVAGVVVHVAAVTGTAVVDMGLIDSRPSAHELGLVLGINTGVGAIIIEVAEEDVQSGSKDGTSERSEGGRHI